jgi:hypothetical protein
VTYSTKFKWLLNKKRGRNDLFLICAPLLGGMLQPFSLVELPTILKEGLNYISENQEEKEKYAYDDLTSVLFKELN